MADLSFSFDPAGTSDAASDALSKAAKASSAIATQSAAWEAGGLGSSAVRSIAKSDAASKVSHATLSLTSAISALLVTADAKASSDAASKVTVARSSAKSWVSAASIVAASAASSDAASKVIAAHADVASSFIKSLPTTGSRAVHEIMMTSAGLIKYVYSSVAVPA